MRPSIVGPRRCPPAGPSPYFVVDTAGASLYVVELARSPGLMAALEGRTQDTYFFGGGADNVFATGPCWRVPPRAWERLCRAHVLYYRVVVLGGSGSVSLPSVEDDHLDLLPTIRMEGR